MWLTAVRDIAIVLLAFESLVIGILLALMLLQLRKLVRTLREEIAPILHTANDTVETVNRTAGFVSHNVVEPVIKVHSYVSGTRQAIRTLALIRRKLRGDGDGTGAG
ncbi:MAG: hypothetical protein FJZ90_10135 [Chloroflexi bacterium]|nr:hypothetical protein [Chloroflexota bacterium]